MRQKRPDTKGVSHPYVDSEEMSAE